MEKTYKVTIWGVRVEHKEMTLDEIAAYRRRISEWIIESFKWPPYGFYRHLVYCAKIDGEFYIYPYGYLMDDEEYYAKVADRLGKDIDRVWAYHKHAK